MNNVGFQPLYKQVYERLISRISDGDWKPSESLPSEHALAEELGVSQGTVRKALNQLEAEKMVERRQGKGTFVSQHTDEASNFRFFRLAGLDGTRLKPEGKIETVSRRPAKRQEKTVLELGDKDQVVEIRRLRIIENTPCAAETIIIPHTLFPGIEKQASLTTSLYPLYQREYGINVVNAEEQLSAELANKQNAKRLGVPVDTPLLKVDRVALTIDNRRVEWRSSFCDTRKFIYSVSVS